MIEDKVDIGIGMGESVGTDYFLFTKSFKQIPVQSTLYLCLQHLPYEGLLGEEKDSVLFY